MAADRSSRGSSQAPQELSLVVYRPTDQGPSLSCPASPAYLAEIGSPARETERHFSPTATLETEYVENWAEHNSLTPKPGNADLSPLSRASSPSSVPLRCNNGKGRAEQYPDEESISDPVGDYDAEMSDLYGQPGPVFLVSSCFCG